MNEDVDRSRILIAEDDADTMELYKFVLRGCSHQVEYANDGREALEMYEQAKAGGKPYGLLWLDHSMPGMTGLEVAEQVRLKHGDAETAIVIFTNYFIDADKDDASRKLNTRVLPKLDHLNDLHSLITSHAAPAAHAS